MEYPEVSIKTRTSFLTERSFTFWFGVVLTAFALGCVVGIGCSDGRSSSKSFDERLRERTLVSILNEASFASFDVGDENFNDACFIIEDMLREKLPETDVPDGRSIASNMRVLVGTYREGSKSISCPAGASLHQVLQIFVSAWDVAAFLDGNTVVFAEVFDQAHFKHEVTVIANSEK